MDLITPASFIDKLNILKMLLLDPSLKNIFINPYKTAH